jgi:hypothetical protein
MGWALPEEARGSPQPQTEQAFDKPGVMSQRKARVKRRHNGTILFDMEVSSNWNSRHPARGATQHFVLREMIPIGRRRENIKGGVRPKIENDPYWLV